MRFKPDELGGHGYLLRDQNWAIPMNKVLVPPWDDDGCQSGLLVIIECGTNSACLDFLVSSNNSAYEKGQGNNLNWNHVAQPIYFFTG